MWVLDVVEAEEGMWCPVLFDFASAAGGVLLLVPPLPPDTCPAEGRRTSIRTDRNEKEVTGVRKREATTGGEWVRDVEVIEWET